MKESKKISALMLKGWKKSFINGSATRTKMRFCNECSEKIL